MASLPPGNCCTKHTLHTGEPKGELTTFGGVSTYVTGSPSSPPFLFLTEIFGHLFLNAQLLADSFALAGYRVIVPDIIQGDAYPLENPTESISEWLVRHGPEVTEPVISAVLTEIAPLVAAAGPNYKLPAVGYCFGAKYLIRHLGREINIGFVAHPSFVAMEELAAITAPLAIAAAETDDIFLRDLRWKSEEKLTDIGATYQINLFSGVEHGFASRGDLGVRQVRWAKERARDMAVEWFRFHQEDTAEK